MSYSQTLISEHERIRLMIRQINAEFSKLDNLLAGIDSSATSPVIYIGTTNNVGIGLTPTTTTSSYPQLQVGLSANLMGNNAGYDGYLISNAYYDAGWKYVTTGPASRLRLNFGGAYTFDRATSGTAGNTITWTESVQFDASGNVGIGGTPVTKFHLIDSGAVQLRITGGDANTQQIQFFSNGTTHNNAAIASTYNAGSPYLSFYNNGSERMRIDTSGNVGIGNTSPAAPLDVRLPSTTTSPIINFSRSDAAVAGHIHYDGSDGAITFGTTTSHPICFDTNNTERVRIDSSGNVGIGTSTMTDKVEIAITSGVNLRLTKATGAYLAFHDGSVYRGSINALNGADGLSFNTGNSQTERMRIDGSGNVGIGVTPSYPFHVNVANANNYIIHLTNSSATTPYGLNFQFSAASPDNNSQTFAVFGDSTTTRCIVYSDGDLANHDGTYGTISDNRIKQDIVDASSQWDDIKAIGKLGKNYRHIKDVEAKGKDAKVMLGWLAQDIETISPGLVMDMDVDGEMVKGLRSSILFTKATIALSEALDRIETLEAKVQDLTARITVLEAA